jgi:hypothetical protein
VTEIDVFHILLEEILLTRPLTVAEKALFLQKTITLLGEELVRSEFLPRLGLSPEPHAIKQTVSLLDLGDEILQAIHRGEINEKVAGSLMVLQPQDRQVLFTITASLHLSFSNQKKLAVMCRELAGRRNISIAELLADEEVQAILDHRETNPPQKTKKLMAWLHRNHMARLSRAKEEFNRFTRSLQLPGNAVVAHTEYFEDDQHTLSVTFPDRDSLQQAWEKISHALRNNEN